jgi:hypothetical protein
MGAVVVMLAQSSRELGGLVALEVQKGCGLQSTCTEHATDADVVQRA